MLIAELHGKAPDEAVVSEDGLTSHVFGSFRALPPEVTLLPWLATARRADGRTLAVPAQASVSYAFWPKFPLGTELVEPDVLLTLEADGVTTLVMVEVKYLSGPSGLPGLAGSRALSGQLGRQWFVLEKLAPAEAPGRPERIDRRVLVYLTLDTSFPADVLSDMGRELLNVDRRPKDFELGCYWLDWRVLADVLEPAAPRYVLVDQLCRLLHRRRIVGFAGFTAPEVPSVPWSFGNPAFFTPPRTPRVDWTFGEDTP